MNRINIFIGVFAFSIFSGCVTVESQSEKLKSDTLYVGKNCQFKSPNEVSKVVKDGDVIIIEPSI